MESKEILNIDEGGPANTDEMLRLAKRRLEELIKMPTEIAPHERSQSVTSALGTPMAILACGSRSSVTASPPSESRRRIVFRTALY
jgi:hypothetical protein